MATLGWRWRNPMPMQMKMTSQAQVRRSQRSRQRRLPGRRTHVSRLTAAGYNTRLMSEIHAVYRYRCRWTWNTIAVYSNEVCRYATMTMAPGATSTSTRLHNEFPQRASLG
eukprot:scaffold1109_cov146-Skeletonema_marinoi.AAC.7